MIDNKMTKRKGNKGETTLYKTLHRKAKNKNNAEQNNKNKTKTNKNKNKTKQHKIK